MTGATALIAPPLSLYVHIPWCVRKCPYCDFNSHVHSGTLPEPQYLDALRRDLDADLAFRSGRLIQTVFFGGGTPSLFTAATIAKFLEELESRKLLSADAEITLEANPGTAEASRFRGYFAAGVNRLSIGVQSFDDARLQAIGRIHTADDARQAIELAVQAGFQNFNIDLMYGLPGQSRQAILLDIETALQYQPTHLSWYQLTIEPNTVFYSHTPRLPAVDATEDAWQEGAERLEFAGYQRYEISAWSRQGHECRHNLNYWKFGDYLGVGAGAHGKITMADSILRTRKPRQPDAYLAAQFPAARVTQPVATEELAQEYLLNRLRLFQTFDAESFEARTGLPVDALTPFLRRARKRGLLCDDRLQPTPAGYRFLDELLMLV